MGATGTITVNERHSYAEGRVPAPHGLPPSPGALAVQRKVTAACQASRRLLEETLNRPGKIFMFNYINSELQYWVANNIRSIPVNLSVCVDFRRTEFGLQTFFGFEPSKSRIFLYLCILT